MGKLKAQRKAMFMFLLLFLHLLPRTSAGPHNYGEALSKSFLFYEAQRSGFLPSNQRVSWRGHSGLTDGKLNGVDLVGGYYDAGDNVKFGLPMAFTITMMSWSVIEYGSQMAAAGELENAMDAVKWGADYLIKAHPHPHVLYGEVGDGNSDHYCWQRPEDMTTSRLAYKIDETNPGSDLAGETAAAMAAASIALRDFNPRYSSHLVNHARQLFEFADGFRGVYDRSITVAHNYYTSVSGYEDELLWAAAWLHQATRDPSYLIYLAINSDSQPSVGQFSWDVKYPGVHVLVSKFLTQGEGGVYESMREKYKQKAEAFMCSQVGKGLQNVRKTPGGLIFVQRWNNMQFVTGASFLLTVYSDYLSSSKSGIHCPSGFVHGAELLDFAKSQVDYILGDNPRSTSYMVGYGTSYPQQVHHRGASIVSIKVDPSFVTCRGGYSTWFSRRGGDPNLLHGAIVGGPGAYDDFDDARENFRQTEPTLYNSAPLIGVLARLTSNSQLLPVILDQPATRSASPVVIKQAATSSWAAKGRTYHRYSARVSNTSPKPLKSLQLVINKLYGPLWGLWKKNGSSYELPEWIDYVPAGRSFAFIYVHASPPADVSVLKYTLG